MNRVYKSQIRRHSPASTETPELVVSLDAE